CAWRTSGTRSTLSRRRPRTCKPKRHTVSQSPTSRRRSITSATATTPSARTPVWCRRWRTSPAF
ncbi:hypothetical protein MUK42_13287, partial [Musa troglodytarum]